MYGINKIANDVHATKVFRGVEVKFHIIVTELNASQQSALRFDRLYSQERCSANHSIGKLDWALQPVR
jgi:hypothetical protein